MPAESLTEDPRQQSARQPSMRWWGPFGGFLALLLRCLCRCHVSISLNERTSTASGRPALNRRVVVAVSGRVREETRASNLIECKPVGSQATREKVHNESPHSSLLLNGYPFGARAFLCRFSFFHMFFPFTDTRCQYEHFGLPRHKQVSLSMTPEATVHNYVCCKFVISNKGVQGQSTL